MAADNDSLAIMLLCCRMSATRQELFDPLSPPEFYALHQKLRKKLKTTPAWMFGRDIRELMDGLEITEQEAHRLMVLMERMVSLSYELDDYGSNGIEVITCIDKRYPKCLPRRLGVLAPTQIYACGNMSLFQHPTLTFAGSIPGDEETEKDTIHLCDAATKAEVVLSTSGTSGLDQVAEFRLYENGGQLITWLPGCMNDLIKRDGLSEMLRERRAVACSIVHPGTPIQTQATRSRAKCLYATGTVSYVPGCEFKRGDTWDGAAEALRNKFTERMYCRESTRYSGNPVLIKRGAVPVAGAGSIDFSRLHTRWVQEEGEQISVFDDRRLIY